MNNINQEIRRVRSLSEQDIGISPFESFADYVNRESNIHVFEQLRQDTEPEENVVEVYRLHSSRSLFESIPVIPVREQVKQKQINLQSRSKLAKILTILITFVLIIYIFYKQKQWQQTQAQYNSKYPTNNYPAQFKNLVYLKQYAQINKIKTLPIQQKQKAQNISYYMGILTKKRKQVKLYMDIEDVQEKQLPFCVYVHEEDQIRQKEIVGSVLESQYENYVIVTPNSEKNILDDQDTNQTQHEDRIIKITHKNHSYFYLKSMLLQYCPTNSLLLFIDSPIQTQTLHKFNILHQNWNMYLTYSQSKNIKQVHTFYLRIFELLDINDFDHSNREELNKGNLQIMAMGMLELCVLKSKNINIEGNFIYQDKNVLSYLLVNANSQKLYKRTQYGGLTRLSQDFYVNLLRDRLNIKQMYKVSQKYKQSYIINAKLSLSKMLKAAELQDFIYLPRNHSLLTRELESYHKLYNTKQYLHKQLPFCISILSHNNIANNRYIKVMLSILKQEYQNYRIVFFDDMSSDDTFNSTIQFMRSVGFDRITYVRNLERKYATYNILNAGFNFCGEDQIQVLLDGDDELIGAHVLSLINGLYQKYPQKWFIYTNFKSNLYEFGQSKPVPSKQSIVKDNARVAGHRLGQLRTFKVKLLRLIPKKYHQTRSGYWLDTVYDDALGHSLFQLASASRIMYVPEICYEYNRQYGDNDDSSQQKLFHRSSVYEYLLGLTPLKQVDDLKTEKADKEMVEIFKKQMESKTFQIVLSAQHQSLL